MVKGSRHKEILSVHGFLYYIDKIQPSCRNTIIISVYYGLPALQHLYTLIQVS